MNVEPINPAVSTDIPVVSPTRTEVWDQCHLKHDLQFVERWVAQRQSKRDLSRLVGIGGAAGLAFYNHVKRDANFPTGDVDGPWDEAGRTFDKEVAHLLAAGVELEMQDVIECRAAMIAGVTKFPTHDPLTVAKGWQVQDIELTLPEHGKARIDWGGIDPDGLLCQVDYKFKMRLEARYKDKEIERFRYSGQMAHYCWAYGEYKMHPIHRYYICLIVLEPRFYVELIPYEVDPELQAAWLASARQKWADMAAQKAGTRIPDMASSHRDAFGDCPYLRACFEFKLDSTLMQTAYVQLPRKEPIVETPPPIDGSPPLTHYGMHAEGGVVGVTLGDGNG